MSSEHPLLRIAMKPESSSGEALKSLTTPPRIAESDSFSKKRLVIRLENVSGSATCLLRTSLGSSLSSSSKTMFSIEASSGVDLLQKYH